MIPFERSAKYTPNVDVEHALAPSHALEFQGLAGSSQTLSLDAAERFLAARMLQNYSVDQILKAFETDGKDTELRRILVLLSEDAKRKPQNQP